MFARVFISFYAARGPDAARSQPEKAPLESEDQSQRFQIYHPVSLPSSWRTLSPQPRGSLSLLPAFVRKMVPLPELPTPGRKRP